MAGKPSAKKKYMEILLERANRLEALAGRKNEAAGRAKELIEAANHLRTEGAEIGLRMPHELVLRRSSESGGAVFDKLADGLLEIASMTLEAEGA